MKLKNGRRTVCLSLVTTSTLKLTAMNQQKQLRHKTRQPELAHLMLWCVVRGLWELQVSLAEPRRRPDYAKALLCKGLITARTHFSHYALQVSLLATSEWLPVHIVGQPFATVTKSFLT